MVQSGGVKLLLVYINQLVGELVHDHQQLAQLISAGQDIEPKLEALAEKARIFVFAVHVLCESMAFLP